jgi:hypothetical protein
MDGSWSVSQFSRCLRDLQQLADYIENGTQPGNYFRSEVNDGAFRILGDRDSLSIVRISLASPGFTDIAGVAAVIRELRLFLEFLIGLYVNRNDRELDREQRRIELERVRRSVLAGETESKIARANPQVLDYYTTEASSVLEGAVFDKRIVSVKDRSDEMNE